MLRFFHWRSLWWRTRFEQEMADEFAFHEQARREDLIRSGLNAEEAARRARLEFGGKERYRTECQEAHRLHWVDEGVRNLRNAVRSLRKNPTFTATAIMSLTLGIGMNTAVFSIFDSLVLKPLPVRDPSRITFIETTTGYTHSFPDYREFRDRNSTFDGIAGYRISVTSFEHGGNPSRMWCYLATGNYFDTLGIKPAAGRFFHQADDRKPNASPYVVLSYATWQARFGGDRAAVGSVVRINGLPYTVLGVAPRGFHGTELFYWPELWIPMMMQPQVEVGNAWLDNRSTWDTLMIGRLKPNVGSGQAAADLNRIASDLAREYPINDKGIQMRLAKPGFLGSGLRGPIEKFAGGVLLLAGLVLLTACFNLAGLMLAKSTDRQRELAIRASIGAGRVCIFIQLLTEAFVLAAVGGVCGCGLAVAVCRIVSGWRAPIGFPVQISIDPDWRMLAFAAGAAIATGLLFGLGPALRASRVDLNSFLKGGLISIKPKHRFAMRDLILAGQVAVCFVLVFGCVLSLEGLQRAITLPLGFEPEGVTVAAVDLGSAGYSEATGRMLQQGIAESLRTLPGVSSVAYANSLPLSIDQSTTSVGRTGESEKQGSQRQHANYYDISPGLLRTLGVRLLQGRDFSLHDGEHAPLVAIVNEAFGKQILGTVNPIGKTFRYGTQSPAIEIVGLVGDGKYVSLTEDPDPVVFRPILQDYNPTTTFVVRSRTSAEALVPQIRKRIARLDPKLPIYGTGSLESMLGFAMFPMHAAAIALSAFGALALLLTLTGIYGLVSYSVARRTRELGIRIAIGARSFELLRLVLGRVLVLACVGLAMGVVLAAAAGPALRSIIYTGSTPNTGLFLEVPAGMIAAALLSCAQPIRQALRVNPVEALRSE